MREGTASLNVSTYCTRTASWRKRTRCFTLPWWMEESPFSTDYQRDRDPLQAGTRPGRRSPHHTASLTTRRSLCSQLPDRRSGSPVGLLDTQLDKYSSPLTLDVTLCLRITGHISLILEPTSLAQSPIQGKHSIHIGTVNASA